MPEEEVGGAHTFSQTRHRTARVTEVAAMQLAVETLSREIAEIDRTAVTPVDDLLAGVNLHPNG
jgi:hypothetical protein